MANEDISAEMEEPQEPAGGVPEDVAADVRGLAADVTELARKTSRGWKIAAVIFAVILVLIATYLGIIYNILKDSTEPGRLVALAVDPLEMLLERVGAPSLTSPQLAGWAVERLNEKAPELVRQRVKPRLVELQGRLPDWRKQALDELRKQAPTRFDSAAQWLEEEGLPTLSDKVVQMLTQRTDIAMEDLEMQFERLVGQVVEAHEEDLRTVGTDNMPRLQATLESELEEKLGPALDHVFGRIERAVVDVEDSMTNLVVAYKSGGMSKQDRLEIQLVRLLYALFQRTEVGREHMEFRAE